MNVSNATTQQTIYPSTSTHASSQKQTQTSFNEVLESNRITPQGLNFH